MPDPIEPDATPVDDAEPIEPTVEPVEGEDALGDAGKKALDAMKAQRNAALAAAKADKAELDRLKAEIAAKDKPAEEVALEKARREATDAATAAANLKLAKSALRLAAKGVLADPADALAFIDSSGFDVDDNGDVDSDALNEAINDLLARKPHLAAKKANPFEGSGDGGARPPAKPTPSAEQRAADYLKNGDVQSSIALKMSTLEPIKP